MPKIVPKSVQTCFEDVLGWFFRKKLFAQCSMEGRVFENFQKKSKRFQKIKKFQNSKNAQNRSQKCPNVFWRCFRVIFLKNFLPSVPWRVESSKIFKKIKKVSKCPKKMPKIVPKNVQTCFEHVLRCFEKKVLPSVFEKKIFPKMPSVPWRVEFHRKFSKNQKTSFKIPKMPKIVPKSVQTCFEDVLGWFFRKIFLPSVPWRVESSKIFKKIKKVSKFQKCPKSSPKVSKRNFSKSNSKFQKKTFSKMSKRVLNMFWGDFFEKKILPSVPWRVESPKIFEKIKKISKFQKCPKFPKSVQTCSEKLFAQCSMVGRVFENFQKKSKRFQNSKNARNRSKKCPNVFWTSLGVIFSKGRVIENCPKSFQKVSKRVLNKFRGDFFEKFFCPVFHGGSSHRKLSNKSKNFQNSKNAQNRSQKCPNVFWTCFRGDFFEKKNFAQCSMEGRVSENFQKIKKISKFQKCPKSFPKSVQTCFEDVLGWFFRKNFLPSVPWWVESSKIFKKKSNGGSSLRKFSKKNQKGFKIPKMPEIVPKSVPTCFEQV